MTTAYPLTWPEHIARSRSREASRFKASLPAALGNVESSLRAFSSDSGKAVSEIVLSSNVTLGKNRPADPGVAVWFLWDGIRICIPVDRYLTPAENLQAIHHVIEARRTELRHGTLALVRASMTGLQALPAPAGPSWHEVLQLAPDATAAAIEAAHKRLAMTRHPDRPGGSEEAMTELNVAKDQALRQAGGRG